MANLPSSPSLTDSIVQDLGLAVVSGKYSECDSLLIEADLCRHYGASRSVLREAVKMLTAKGLLLARPRRGTQVQPPDRWNLLDPDVLRWLLEHKLWLDLLTELTQVRLAIEPAAAALAAQVAGPAEKAAIQQAVERVVSAERGGDDPLEADIAFHTAVLEASGNKFFMQLRELIRTALRCSTRIPNGRKGVRLGGMRDHRRFVAAITTGDAEAASSLMQGMIQKGSGRAPQGRVPTFPPA